MLGDHLALLEARTIASLRSLYARRRFDVLRCGDPAAGELLQRVLEKALFGRRLWVILSAAAGERVVDCLREGTGVVMVGEWRDPTARRPKGAGEHVDADEVLARWTPADIERYLALASPTGGGSPRAAPLGAGDERELGRRVLESLERLGYF